MAPAPAPHRRVGRRPALAALCALPFVPLQSMRGYAGETSPQITQDLEVQAAHFLSIEPPDRRAANVKFFSEKTSDELAQLMTHSNPTIAMRSAWEVVRRNGVSRQAVVQFLKTAEESGSLRLPSWWRRALVKCESDPKDFRLLRLDPSKYPAYVTSQFGWHLYAGLRMESKNGQLHLEQNNSRALLPKEIVKHAADNHANCVTACIERSAMCIAAHAGVDAFIPLYYYDVAGREPTWRAELQVAAKPIFSMGYSDPAKKSGSYALTLELDRDRIIAYGGDSVQLHVEAFGRSDGAPLFRFSTLV